MRALLGNEGTLQALSHWRSAAGVASKNRLAIGTKACGSMLARGQGQEDCLHQAKKPDARSEEQERLRNALSHMGAIPWRLARPGGHRHKRERKRARNAPLNQREHSTRCAKFLITFSRIFVGTCSSENDETFRDPCRMLRASERLAAYLVTLKSNHRAPQSRNTGGGAFQQTC